MREGTERAGRGSGSIVIGASHASAPRAAAAGLGKGDHHGDGTRASGGQPAQQEHANGQFTPRAAAKQAPKKARPELGFAVASRNPYFVAAFFSSALAFTLAFGLAFFTPLEDWGDGVAGVAFLVSTPVCALGAAGVAGSAFGAWANAVSVNAEASNVTSSFFNMENPPVFESRSDSDLRDTTHRPRAR